MFLGNPNCAFALLFDPGGFARIRPVATRRCCPRTDQDEGTHEKPTFEAQSHGFDARCLRFAAQVTQRHARLASGRWPGVTGQACSCRIPAKGFRFASYITSSFPKLHGARSARFVSAEELLGYIYCQ